MQRDAIEYRSDVPGASPSSHASTPAAIPSTGYVRLWQIIGCKKRGLVPVIPVSRSTWLAGVRIGRTPAAVKLGPRTTAWYAADIQSLAARIPG